MAVAPVARYTGSALDLVLAIAFLGIAAIHAIAGVPTAVLPAVGGLVLLGAALATAPVTRRWLRRSGGGRADVLVFLGALIVAGITLVAFTGLGGLF